MQKEKGTEVYKYISV